MKIEVHRRNLDLTEQGEKGGAGSLDQGVPVTSWFLNIVAGNLDLMGTKIEVRRW
jgi:hypothetical protein